MNGNLSISFVVDCRDAGARATNGAVAESLSNHERNRFVQRFPNSEGNSLNLKIDTATRNPTWHANAFSAAASTHTAIKLRIFPFVLSLSKGERKNPKFIVKPFMVRQAHHERLNLMAWTLSSRRQLIKAYAKAAQLYVKALVWQTVDCSLWQKSQYLTHWFCFKNYLCPEKWPVFFASVQQSCVLLRCHTTVTIPS